MLYASYITFKNEKIHPYKPGASNNTYECGPASPRLEKFRQGSNS